MNWLTPEQIQFLKNLNTALEDKQPPKEYLIERPATKSDGLRLFEVAYTKAALDHSEVYRFLYENKQPHCHIKGQVFSYFINKDEARHFRDMLNRHVKQTPPFHISYGPDHKRYRGKVQ